MKNCGKGVALFQLIPPREFQELCNRFQIDKGVRRLTAQRQVWALVMAFVLRLESLREIESAFGIPRSTLSDANANREVKFFRELCRLVLWRIYEKQRSRQVRQAIRTLLAIDSTECQVHGSLSKLNGWRSKNKSKDVFIAGAKLHVNWNLTDECIEEAIITPARAADSPTAKTMKIRANCTYVFDRAYNDISFWWRIIRSGSNFVTRLKNYGRYRSRRFSLLQKMPNQTGVLWEGGWTPSVLYKHPSVPKGLQLRHIIYRDPETKKVFDFVTSDTTSPAQEIADIYKKRWAVELLFRWLKGHLKVRRLEPRNTNAIQIQLTMAVLVQLLIGLYRILSRFSGTLWECLRKLRTDWTRTGLDKILQNTEKIAQFAPRSTPRANRGHCYP